MYWLGELLEKENQIWPKEESWETIKEKKHSFINLPLEDIIQCLDEFSHEWNENTLCFQEAIWALTKESGFSSEEVIQTLKILPRLLCRESLEKRIISEFHHLRALDQFCKLPDFQGKVRAIPRGTLLHVTAGNVFLSSIDSLIMGFLTKNISILKVSSQNQFFPLYFARKLKAFDQKMILADKFAILHWKGGDRTTENFIIKKVDTVMAWGGEEMLATYRENLPSGVKLLDFGPKISFQVITKEGLKGKNISQVAQKIVQDIVPWDQAACASPQNMYLEEGLDEEVLLLAIEEAFKKAPKSGEKSEDEAVEILKEKYRAQYSALMEDGRILEGENYLIHLEKAKYLRPSPLNRSLIVKRFKDEKDLGTHLEPFSFYLQSCSYLLSAKEKETYLPVLALAGIKRFAPLGMITWGMDGAPHDGRFVMRELVHFVVDEERIQDFQQTIQTSTQLKQYFEKSSHPPGYLFSSGGTTGEPKYVHFSYEEFDTMTDMLAKNLTAQGIKAGTTVANLFVAGNLWSSFLAVEKALEKIGAIQLPIGGLCPTENILTYLKKFQPQVVMGIPSLLVMNAEEGLKQGLKLNIEKVFYAGEAMSQSRRDFLKQAWQVKYFGSSGYASVDAGVIGYQCELCEAGEHHLFSEFIHMDIVEDEAIVTSIGRTSLPIQNYATGDRVEWIPDCRCGRKDRRFKLLGRIDNTIQIWSSRILLSDLEKVLQELDENILTFQLELTEVREANVVREKLELRYEVADKEIDPLVLIKSLYQASRDLKDTLSLEDFMKNIQITALALGAIPRNPRTGKISLIKDLRQ